MGGKKNTTLATRPKCNAILGELPVLQYCPVEQLDIDESYQRSLEAADSITLIRRIAIYWDWGLCQPLYVSRRADGKLYVVDGQHRLAAAKLRGDIWQLPCVVRSFDTAQAEAAAFVALNQERRPLNKLQIFKASVAAGDIEAAQIVMCVTDAGLRIATSTNIVSQPPGALCNIAGLQNCYRVMGVQVLTEALLVLAKAYPDQALRYAGSIFPGIVKLVAESRKPEDMIKLVAGWPQEGWMRRINIYLTDNPMSTRKFAAERVFAAAAQGETIERPPEARQGGVIPSPTVVPAMLLPAETDWCTQCDQRVSGARVEKCTDRHCKMKVAKAA